MINPIYGWFNYPGAFVLVDGQFGSTGKGLLTAYIACYSAGKITHVTTNAGPNSGHTAYDGDYKVMTQQIPVASVFLHRLNAEAITILNAGAIIDPDILAAEIARYDLRIENVFVHPNAAIIDAHMTRQDQVTLEAIASTGKGVGPAMMRKIGRHGIYAVAQSMYTGKPPGVRSWDSPWDWSEDVVFVETAQGFSLGLNSRFYPHVTSRECTVGQAIADARIPPQMLRRVACTFRTYPIRVGNTSRSSGGCYSDQRETTWGELGLEPELTTVTKRVRRVFTFSREQFRECIEVNRPDLIFLNFCNYLTKEALWNLTHTIEQDYNRVMERTPETFLLGFGPKINQICTLDEWHETGGSMNWAKT